jgi:hypothetical protein
MIGKRFDHGVASLNEFLPRSARRSQDRGGAKTLLNISEDEMARPLWASAL